MTHAHAKHESHWLAGSKDTVETDGQTNMTDRFRRQ